MKRDLQGEQDAAMGGLYDTGRLINHISDGGQLSHYQRIELQI